MTNIERNVANVTCVVGRVHWSKTDGGAARRGGDGGAAVLDESMR